MKKYICLLTVALLASGAHPLTSQAAAVTSTSLSAIDTYYDNGYSNGQSYAGSHLDQQDAIDQEIAYAQSQMDYYQSQYNHNGDYQYWMGYRDGLTQNRY